MAQFEAFKVYEDEETAERKCNKSNVCKIEEATECTKTVAAEIGKKTEKHVKDNACMESPKREILSPAKPMSVDKNLDDSIQLAEDAILKNSKNMKDRFFEVEEYREKIYIYLREHEVRLLY